MNVVPQIEDLLSSGFVVEDLRTAHAKLDFGHFVHLAFTTVQTSGILSAPLHTLCSRDVAGVSKHQENALRVKDRGGASFKKGLYIEAAEHYSNSLREVAHNGVESRQLASILHSNRALCLLKTGKDLDEALDDCNQALLLDPGNRKAAHRKLQCLQAQQRKPSVKECVSSTQLASRPGDLHRARSDDDLAAQPQGEGGSIPEAESQEGPAASSCSRPRLEARGDPEVGVMELRCDDIEGRHLAARCAISKGQEILSEAAHIALLQKSHRKSRCWRCMGLLKAHACMPCPRCAAAVYCSAACQRADTSHCRWSQMCGVPWPLLLPSEAVLAALLAADARGGSQLQLQSHFAGTAFQDLIPSLALACLVAACWNTAQASEPAGTADELSAEAVFEALLQVRVNAIAIVPPQHSLETSRIGLAIYRTASCFNHSCSPNLVFRFEGQQLQAAACQDICQGEILRHCYGPQVGEMTTQQRQAMLVSQYAFVCRCPGCMHPSLSEAEMVGLRCPQCSAAVLPSCQVEAGVCSLYPLPPGDGLCIRSAHQMPAALQQDRLASLRAANQEFLRSIGTLRGLSTSGPHPAATAAVDEALEGLTRCLQIQEDLLAAGNQRLGKTLHAVGQLNIQIGNPEIGREQLQRALGIVELQFGKESLVAENQRRDIHDAFQVAPAR